MILPKSDIGLYSSEEISCSFVDSNKSPIMKLSKSEESENSDGAGIKFIDTPDSDNKGNFRSWRDMNLAIVFSISSGCNLYLLFFGIIGFILLNSLEEFLSLGFVDCSTLFSLFF